MLNDDEAFDLLKAAVEREGSQAAFAKRFDVNRSELSSILNGRRRISASLAKALGLRKVYVAERDCAAQVARLVAAPQNEATRLHKA